MKEKFISARTRPDGSLVQVLGDGTEVPLIAAPIENREPLEWADDELTDDQLARMKPVPAVKRLRWKLSLSQQQFAERFQIPLGTLRDWEQGRSEPDATARAYIKVIAFDPVKVAQTFQPDDEAISLTKALAS